VKKKFYTLPGETEEERQLVERIYGDHWESDYHRVVDLVTDDDRKVINDETRHFVISTVTSLLFRTIKWQLKQDGMMRQVFTAAVQHSMASGAEYVMIENERISLVGKSIDELVKDFEKRGRPARIITQLKMAIRLAQVRMNDAIGVVKLDGPDNFITSDHPVGIWNQNDGIIVPFSPTNVLSLPVNNKYRIDLYPPSDIRGKNHIARVVHSGLMATAEAAVSNDIQFQQCEYYLLGDQKTLDHFDSTRNDQALVDSIMAEYKIKIPALIDLAKSMGIDHNKV